MRVSGEMDVVVEEWKCAAISYSNLSELEATQGRLGDAVSDGRRVIGFADQSGDSFWRMGTRTTAADALHQSGERAEARALFEEAERIPAPRQSAKRGAASLEGIAPSMPRSTCRRITGPARNRRSGSLHLGARFQRGNPKFEARNSNSRVEEFLNENQQIAERGPMPLYPADAHLHRARVFRDRAKQAKARELIEKHGYWRRREELEDAKRPPTITREPVDDRPSTGYFPGLVVSRHFTIP